MALPRQKRHVDVIMEKIDSLEVIGMLRELKDLKSLDRNNKNDGIIIIKP